MALTIVFLVGLALALTDGFQTNSTDILTSLQERLSLSSCDSISVIKEVLMREIEVRAKHQAEVESEIVKLQSQLMNGTVGPAIAFSALGRADQMGLTRYQKINFQDMLTNIGGGYNKDTSVFRCPVRGVYQFVVTILTKPNKVISTELVAAGVCRMKIYSVDEVYFGSGTSSVLLELQAGDEVYVRVHDGSDKYVRGGYWSTFNGHLVHKL